MSHEKFHHLERPVIMSGQEQRRIHIVVSRIHFRSVIYEQLDDLEMAPFRGKMQRGIALLAPRNLSNIHIRSRFKSGSYRVQVSFLGSSQQPVCDGSFIQCLRIFRTAHLPVQLDQVLPPG
ncbi:MAG: hypothetical protein PHO83_01230 [Geobacteraceae bacterium]|nr:hypothetical protein [Geobacteraceae bacterium]